MGVKEMMVVGGGEGNDVVGGGEGNDGSGWG